MCQIYGILVHESSFQRTISALIICLSSAVDLSEYLAAKLISDEGNRLESNDF